MAKRGRPPATRRGPDVGTPELIAKRQALIGARRQGWPEPDMTAAESALGCLLWQGYLHPDYATAKRMHDAGVMFCGWWTLKYPKMLTGTLGRLQPGGGAEAVDTTEAERCLREVGAVLKDRAVLDAVINTVVYQRVNLRRIEQLRVGLQRLMGWQRSKTKASPVNVLQQMKQHIGVELPGSGHAFA